MYHRFSTLVFLFLFVDSLLIPAKLHKRRIKTDPVGLHQQLSESESHTTQQDELRDQVEVQIPPDNHNDNRVTTPIASSSFSSLEPPVLLNILHNLGLGSLGKEFGSTSRDAHKVVTARDGDTEGVMRMTIGSTGRPLKKRRLANSKTSSSSLSTTTKSSSQSPPSNSLQPKSKFLFPSALLQTKKINKGLYKCKLKLPDNIAGSDRSSKTLMKYIILEENLNGTVWKKREGDKVSKISLISGSSSTSTTTKPSDPPEQQQERAGISLSEETHETQTHHSSPRSTVSLDADQSIASLTDSLGSQSISTEETQQEPNASPRRSVEASLSPSPERQLYSTNGSRDRDYNLGLGTVSDDTGDSNTATVAGITVTGTEGIRQLQQPQLPSRTRFYNPRW